LVQINNLLISLRKKLNKKTTHWKANLLRTKY